MQIYSEKSLCCGCTACYNVCPVKAILMKEDEEGFFYPVIDEKKCIKCGKCKDVCAFINGYSAESGEQHYYAARSKDESILRKSSSGGIFLPVASRFIASGGCVYGAAFDENLEIVHTKASSIENLYSHMGSKYAQSSLADVYQEVGMQLINGEKVLFTGTPCQVSGLKNYLRCKKINDNALYSIDIICHGVNSPMILKDYIAYGERLSGIKVSKINMRDKKHGWKSKKASFYNEEGELNPISEKCPYNKLYSSLLGVRESCYQCIYTSMQRIADITLGDFWNMPEQSMFADDKGVSTVIVNSKKGQELLKQCWDELYIEEQTSEKIYQPHLEFPSAKPRGREKFWKEYAEKGAEYAIQKYSKGTIMSNVFKICTPILKKVGLYRWGAQLYKKVFR